MLAICLLIAAAAPSGCKRPVGRAAGPVVLVVIDTLRTDHVSCYGGERPTTPESCALAADGALFERAYTPRTETTPAIASMLTGLYPHRHGVRHIYTVLPDAVETLPEKLGAAGFETGGFVSSFVMVRDFSGFAQGFDLYDDRMTRPEPFARISRPSSGPRLRDGRSSSRPSRGPIAKDSRLGSVGRSPTCSATGRRSAWSFVARRTSRASGRLSWRGGATGSPRWTRSTWTRCAGWATPNRDRDRVARWQRGPRVLGLST